MDTKTTITLLLLVLGGIMVAGTLLAGAGADKAPEKPGLLVAPPAKISDPRPGSSIDLSRIHEDTTPELNILNPKNPNYGKIPLQSPRRKLSDATPSPGTGDYGTYISGGMILGVSAWQEVHPSLDLPSPDPDRTLYAPTLQAPNNAPLESVTRYMRLFGMGYTSRDWGVWDHTINPPGFVIIKPINNPTFLSNYVRTYPEGQLYWTLVYYKDNAWRVMLYNFNTQWWEEQYSSTASSTITYGWDGFETYFNNTCPNLPNIESKDLRVYVNGQWPYVTSTYGSLLDYQNCAYAENMISPYYHWSVGP